MPINILVDIEATGPSPFSGLMTEFGAVALNHEMSKISREFEGVLIEAAPDPNIPAKPLVLETSKRHNEKEVMKNFHEWLISFGERVVFVSDNPAYDFQWISYYFDKNGLENPFGYSGRRISDFWAGLNNDWINTQKWKKFRRTKHSHRAVEDSRGNAEALITLISMTR